MITCRGRLPKALARTLAARGYRRLTPVQRAVLRIEAADADLLVSAGTGSGKTIAYGLAVARRLFASAAPDGTGPRALVITPTRELARQVAGELGWLLAGTGFRVGACTGGSDARVERAALAAGLDVVAGTPGRLLDHLRSRAFEASGIRVVVLDEADQMLDAEFRAELGALFAAMPVRRQTLLFSATIGPAVETLARQIQTDALRIELGRGPRGMALQAVAVAPGDRETVVANLLRLHEAPAALVFCGRREAVRAMAQRLAARGFAVVALSGGLGQPRRNAALAAMRAGQARVCVATDVAARGLDLPGLDLVVHADLPASAEILLHRSGRTGRAGRGGLAILVVGRRERRRAEALVTRAGLSLEWIAAPDPAQILARDVERMLAEIAAAPTTGPAGFLARPLVGAGAERLAAAFARIWQAGRPVPGAIAGEASPGRGRQRRA